VFGRELLSAARADAHSKGRDAAAVEAAIALAAKDAHVSDAPAAHPGGGVTSAGMPIAVKAALGMGVAGVLALAVVRGISGPSPAPHPTAQAAPPAAPAAAPPAPAAPAPTETTVSVYDLPAAPQATHTRAPSAPPATSAAQDRSGDGMDAELALLRTARAALHAGDAAGALDAIARYEAEFPKGSLRPEAAALAINAEIAAGRPNDARRRADAFLAQYPDSPLAPRVRKARDETSAP
jgi:hypothetical protein